MKLLWKGIYEVVFVRFGVVIFVSNGFSVCFLLFRSQTKNVQQKTWKQNMENPTDDQKKEAESIKEEEKRKLAKVEQMEETMYKLHLVRNRKT